MSKGYNKHAWAALLELQPFVMVRALIDTIKDQDGALELNGFSITISE